MRSSLAKKTFFKKTIFFLFFSLLFSFSFFSLYHKTNTNALEDNCCHHECNLTDPPKCYANKVYVCQDDCDTDPYRDWCLSDDCPAKGQICFQGLCQNFSSLCVDNDNDGFFVGDENICGNNDCDDTLNYIHPGATETCDGNDNDCDGEVDEDCDQDDDDYCDFDKVLYNTPLDVCPNTNVVNGSKGDDCDDNNAQINPGAREICGNTIDDDCSGDDEPCPACAENWTCTDWGTCVNGTHTRTCTDSNNCGTENNKPEESEACSVSCVDNDNDGYGNPASSACAHGELDCNDNDSQINPGATEICGDGVDNNCDGVSQVCGFNCTDECLTGERGCLDDNTFFLCGEVGDGDSCLDKISIPCDSGSVCNSSSLCSIDACQENWSCDNWTACVNGEQTRNCTDLNNCGKENNKPDTQRLCLSSLILWPPNNYSFSQGSDISFYGQAKGGSGEYSFRWQSDKQGLFLDLQNGRVDTSLWQIGEHTINFTVLDSDGLSTDSSIKLNILNSDDFFVNVVLPQNQFAQDPNNLASFFLQVFGGTPPYTYTWSSDKEGVFLEEMRGNVDVSRWDLGEHHIDVLVKDSEGKTASANTDIEIVKMLLKINLPIDNSSFYLGDDIRFSAVVQGGLAPFNYSLKSDKDGILLEDLKNYDNFFVTSINYLTPGLHNLTLELTDSSNPPLFVNKTVKILIKNTDVSKVRCFDYTDCNDNNPCTEDTCLNPGLVSSSCSNDFITVCKDGDNCCPGGCNKDNDSECSVSADNDDPAKVLIVYNAQCNIDENNNGVGDYYEDALFYQYKRKVPEKNILAVYPSVGSSGCSSYYYKAEKYPDFVNEVINPLQNKLSELGENNIYYLLLIGLPTTIYVDSDNYATRSLDQALITLNNISASTSYPRMFDFCYSSGYCEKFYGATLSKTRFNHSFKYADNDIYLVTRIHNSELINRALYGEKYIYNEDGYYRGTAYVDTRYGEYEDSYLDDNYPSFSDASSYSQGDRKIAYAKRIFEDAGWNYKWESSAKEIGEDGAIFTDSSSAESVSDALWYAGWYNYNTYHNVWKWKAGSVACDLNSNSARIPGTTFLNGAFNNGLTAGVGVMSEPYLTGHPAPDVFIYYILNGYNFAEASNLSYPALKWRDIAYGDPLYNPNKKNKEKVIDDVAPQINFIYHQTSSLNGSIGVDIVGELNLNSSNPELATFKLEYGPDNSYGQTIDYDEIYSSKRIFHIDSLSGNSLYHYRLSAKDPVGNVAVSSDFTFNTPADASLSPPGSSIVISPEFIGTHPFVVDFSFSADEEPVEYIWDFGGGNFDSSRSPKHTFDQIGFYPVVLSLKFSNGTTGVAKTLIIVK